MESKKINQLATAVSPSTSDLAIIGDPVTGVSKKITWLQVSTLIGTAANLQQVTDNGATTTNPVTIGGLTISGLSTGVLKSDSGVISSVPFGAANGVATLAGDGKVPSSQLPSYVDDVFEVANYAALPATGETGKLYITLDNNKVYRWSGSVYVEVAANSAVWGSITGTLSNQTDLQNALNAKVPTSRTITINGTSYDLSANRTWSVGTLTSVAVAAGVDASALNITGSPLTGTGGTINIGFSGTTLQYVDGTGGLKTFPTSLPPTGAAGGDLSGTYPNPNVDRIHGIDMQSGTPTASDVWVYGGSPAKWQHQMLHSNQVTEDGNLFYTDARARASVSATTPLSYNNTTGVFSIQVATSTQNGYLASADWSTFNNKQAALGGTGFVKITGSTISYDNSTYYLASNPSGYITLASLSAGAGISYSNITGVISSTITQYTDALARAAISSSATGLTYTSATGVFSLTAGYSIPTTAKQTEWDTAYTNRITSLTTTGSSGAATLVSNTLNVPTYTLSGLGGQPLDADLTAIAALAGTSGFLKKTAADTWALDTNTYLTGNQTITLSGDVTGSGATAITTTIGAGKVTNAMLAGSIDLTTKVTGLLPDGNIASAATWNAKQAAITLTTTGTSGVATFISNTLNIPNYTYTLPTASTSVLGGVKVDGTTITINGSGVISGANTYSLPIATSSILGGVKIGSGVSVDVNGVISVSTNYQAPLNGTGFVKASGTTITYDNTTYATDSLVVHKAGTETITGFKTFNAPIGGGSGDFTNVTSAPLKISSGASDIWRIPHTSTSATQSGVYNYEVGKNVYWGEAADGGDYYFRGRNFKVTDDAVNFSVTTYGLGYLRGNFGIGTTAVNTPFSPTIAMQLGLPANTLSLFTIAGTQGSIYFADGTSSTAVNMGIIEYFHATDYMSFSSGGTEALRLLSDQSAKFLGDVKIENGQVDLILNSTGTTNYSRLFFYDNGTEKGVIQYINSEFSTTSRKNKLELANIGGIDFITTGIFSAPDFQLLTTGAAYFKGSVQAASLGIGGVPLSELYVSTGTIRIDGTNPTLYLRGGATGQKGRIVINHFGYYSYDIVVGDAANGMFSIGRTGETPVFNISSNNRIGIGTTSSNALLQLSSNYGGGTGDYTDITDAPLKIVGLSASTYWRIPHISTSSGISGVYNYQTGKDVYWGEPEDTGNYRFRGRKLIVGDLVTGGGALQVNGDVNINGNFKINGTTIGGGSGSGVTGSGTSGYLTKWTGASTLGNSSVYINGSYVGINTAAASGFLQVNNTSAQTLLYTTTGNLELTSPEDVTSYIRLGAAYGMKGVYSGEDLNLFAANGDMVFRKNNTIQFARFFSNTYNLSIGTSSDLGYRLNVSGDVNITGNYRINGTLLSNGIGGSGTSDYIPRFVSTTGLGNSTIQDNGTYATFTSTTYVALAQNIIWKGTSGTTYDFSMGNGGYGMYILSAAEIDLNAPIGMRYGLIYTFKGNGSSAYNVNILNSGIAADELQMLGGLRLNTQTAGFIPPKMTTTQKNALSSSVKVAGCIVYDTTANLLQCWNGASWNNLW